VGFVILSETYKVDGDQATLEGINERGGRRIPITVRRIEDDKVQIETASPVDYKTTIGSMNRIK